MASLRVRYFHGGIPGLKPGDHLLPPSKTKARCASDYGAAHVHDRDSVYVTTKVEGAVLFAAVHPSKPCGMVYEVRPMGKIKEDPDCHQVGLSFSCDYARVLARIYIAQEFMDQVRSSMLTDFANKETVQ